MSHLKPLFWSIFATFIQIKCPLPFRVQRGGRIDCQRIALSGGSALQEFFNFLLLNNSAIVRSLDNILVCTLSDQPNPSDRCRGNML